MPLKIGGRIVDGPKQLLLVLPRGDAGDIPFKFIAVLDDDEFEKLCPSPKAPTTMKVGVGLIENVEDPKYKAQLQERGEQRANWFFLNSIRPSEIEWQKVKLEDPSTWHLWREELKEAGFSVAEVNTLYDGFLSVNTVNERMVSEARLRFLHGLAEAALARQPSQTSAQESTESGSPANGGESVPQG